MSNKYNVNDVSCVFRVHDSVFVLFSGPLLIESGLVTLVDMRYSILPAINNLVLYRLHHEGVLDFNLDEYYVCELDAKSIDVGVKLSIIKERIIKALDTLNSSDVTFLDWNRY